MNRLLTTTAVALTATLVAAGTAQAACDVMMGDYDARLQERPEYRAQLTAPVQRDLRQLRDAAYILKQHEQEDACEAVVASMESLVENPEEAAELSAAYEEWTVREQERIKNATPLSELSGQISAEQMIDADVRNHAGEDLGEIDDVVFVKDGGGSYVVLSRGGFLGLGEKQVALPFDILKVSPERDTFYADLSVEQIENGPSFEHGDLSWLDDEEARRKNDEYYGNT